MYVRPLVQGDTLLTAVCVAVGLPPRKRQCRHGHGAAIRGSEIPVVATELDV